MKKYNRFIINVIMIFAFINYSHASWSMANVGLCRTSIPFKPTKSELKLLIWYPTSEKPDGIRFGEYIIPAKKDAKIINRHYGLVLISHGSGGSHLGHRDTAMFLAKRNYIVVSLLHPKNNYIDNRSARKPENWIHRPGHISAAMDFMLEKSDFKNFIEKSKIAVIGHSAGGYTALSLAGGIPDIANIRRHCSKHNDDFEFCGSAVSIFRFLNYISPIRHLKETRIVPNSADQRIKAVVLLAPVGVLFADQHALDNVNVPVQIYRAKNDEVLRYPYHAESIRKKLGNACEYIVVEKAGHYAFISPFPDEIKERVGIIAKDPSGFDRKKFHAQLNEDIFDFLSKALKQQ